MAYEKLKEQIIKDCCVRSFLMEQANKLLELRRPPFPRPIKCYYGRPIQVNGGPEISAEVFRAIYRGDIIP